MKEANLAETGMRVGFVIWKLNQEKKAASLKNICLDPFMKGISKEKVVKAIEFLWDWGHLYGGYTIEGNKNFRTWGLEYPDSMIEYAKVKGWITIETKVTYNIEVNK
jgi:hypothetical protein